MRIATVVLLCCAAVAAQETEKLEQAKRAVVGVQARRAMNMGGRSFSMPVRQVGVVIGKEGLVLTATLGEEAQDIRVFLPGTTEAVEAEVADSDDTFTVLRLTDAAPDPVEFTQEWTPATGQKVYWIGLLAGGTGRWTPLLKEGRVDALIESETSNRPLIYSDPPFGGPVTPNGALVLNSAGDAVGVVIPERQAAQQGGGRLRMARRAGAGLPVIRPAASFAQYLAGAISKRGMIGISVEPLTEKVAEALGLKGTRGVIITQITPGSGAANAGIEAQDVLTKIDGQEVANSADVQRALRGKAAGTTVSLDLVRMTDQGPAQQALKVTLTAREEFGKEHRFKAKRFGFTVEPLTPMVRRNQELAADVQGVHVRRVTQGGPASLARPSPLRRGDVILKVGETLVPDVEALKKALAAIPDGKATALFVRHATSTRFVEVTPEPPAD
ncbi:MAG: PDZ domain-containing protein [Planctomycetota bacterium]|jgi:S1-C subfamily serine protease